MKVLLSLLGNRAFIFMSGVIPIASCNKNNDYQPPFLHPSLHIFWSLLHAEFRC